MEKLNIAFVCVHNSCRSQMAEAICKSKYSEYFNAFSAGTHIKDKINQDAVAIVKKKFNIDMNETQRNKLIDELPAIDIVITMGCNVDCPYLACRYREDFGLTDPSGENEFVFDLTVDLIDEKIKNLVLRLQTKEVVLV